MIRKTWLYFFVLLPLFACVSDNATNDVDFTLQYVDLDTLTAARPLDSMLTITFSSKDSLQCEFIADIVVCGQEVYRYRSILENDSILDLVYENHTNRTCGGAYRTKVVLSAWSKDHDLRPITRIDFSGYMLMKNKNK